MKTISIPSHDGETPLGLVRAGFVSRAVEGQHFFVKLEQPDPREAPHLVAAYCAEGDAVSPVALNSELFKKVRRVVTGIVVLT